MPNITAWGCNSFSRTSSTHCSCSVQGIKVVTVSIWTCWKWSSREHSVHCLSIVSIIFIEADRTWYTSTTVPVHHNRLPIHAFQKGWLNSQHFTHHSGQEQTSAFCHWETMWTHWSSLHWHLSLTWLTKAAQAAYCTSEERSLPSLKPNLH